MQVNFYIGSAFQAYVHQGDDHMNVVCPFRINAFVSVHNTNLLQVFSCEFVCFICRYRRLPFMCPLTVTLHYVLVLLTATIKTIRCERFVGVFSK